MNQTFCLWGSGMWINKQAEDGMWSSWRGLVIGCFGNVQGLVLRFTFDWVLNRTFAVQNLGQVLEAWVRALVQFIWAWMFVVWQTKNLWFGRGALKVIRAHEVDCDSGKIVWFDLEVKFTNHWSFTTGQVALDGSHKGSVEGQFWPCMIPWINYSGYDWLGGTTQGHPRSRCLRNLFLKCCPSPEFKQTNPKRGVVINNKGKLGHTGEWYGEWPCGSS